MGRASTRRRVVRVTVGATPDQRVDTVAGEEPLELRLGGKPLAVTMRTPGDDMDLAVGFLVGEGLIGSGADVRTMRYCAGTDDDGRQTYNVLDLVLDPAVPEPDLTAAARSFYMTSSCGLCGKASIEAIRLRSRYTVADDPLRVEAATLTGLPAALRRAQRLFATTGGLHAAALADEHGHLDLVREDVGRHNAVDKVVGAAARAGLLPLRGRVLLVSGRASFELTQKALLAGIPMLAAVSAPSALAVDLAAESGMTLVGFLRGDSMNVYAGAERIVTMTSRPEIPLHPAR
ncbi:formate dehydrogenase accessory sulfurtransferase FdhD [Frankia sp. AgB1.9]|uniref:formate dehydrogenase accessory sulfurtransferase FdhD n=1 Tax=unclassified Frankia TaxID=2632575 RepID=UPI0019314632|nr:MULTISPECIES: formate dehydrogenase accessory sulfurtransferase FdhD [unclassified Frankia]MBL7493164.1 formate dehydrogenase accessory sulfurtransferase FdhD [Frankia sp. AgW1.1]MBL7550661.1 formate dehydrogenase accessory sulfurtransferase FdhD [Frankia sp. AgB1.9]MBL7618096.1 formate dehydrogenase accessory sulfurtransferase FdhD [Frankia sp. AgB1.8]